MAPITEEVKRNVRSILISNPYGVKIEQFPRDYRKLLGHTINYRSLGYKTVIEFMEALPDVAKMEWSPRDGNYRIFAVTDKDLYLPSALKKGTRPTTLQNKPVPPGLMQQWQKDLSPNLKGQYAVTLLRAPGITREDISEDFAAAGEIAEVSMTKRYVFVRYNSKEEALNALEKLYTKYELWIPEERMEPREVVKKKDAYLKNKKATQDVDLVEVYVGGLPRNITVEEVLQRIDQNQVQSVRDMRKEDRRYMFLIVKRDNAEEIAKQLHHQVIDGHKILAQLAYIYKEPATEEEDSEESFSNKVVKGHVGALKDLNYERSSSSESIDTCGSDVNQISRTMSMPPLEPVMPDLEPALPDLEPALPDLEPALPDLEPTLPDLEPALPGLKPAKQVRPVHEKSGQNNNRSHHHASHWTSDSSTFPQHLNQPGLLPTPAPLMAEIVQHPIHHQHQAHYHQMSYNGHHRFQAAHHSSPTAHLNIGARLPNPLIGHHNPSAGHHNPSAGHRNPSAVHRYPSAGHHNPSAGYHNPSAVHHTLSAGHHIPSAGHHNPSTGHHNPSIGHHNPSAGYHNPSGTHHMMHTGHRNSQGMQNGGPLSNHRQHKPQSLHTPSAPANNTVSDEERLRSFKPGTGLLHIENFPPGTNWAELKDIFHSPPFRVQVDPVESGRTPHAVAFFSTKKLAEEGLRYDGAEFKKRELRVYMQSPDSKCVPLETGVDSDVPASLTVNINNSRGDERQVHADVAKKAAVDNIGASLAKQSISTPRAPSMQGVESNEWLENKMEDSVRRAVAGCCPGKAIWTPSDLSEEIIDILVTHVVDDTYLWGQVLDPETEEELNWLMTMTPEISDEANHMEFTIGSQTCIAMFEDEWFRGHVMEIKRDTASVFSLDYGNTVKVPRQSLRDLPEDLWNVTAQVWPVKVTSSDCKTGHELLHRKIRVKVLNKEKESPLLVVKVLEL